MLSQDQFFDLVRERLGQELNTEQAACVATPAEALLIIAGPGTGKTTTMVLRALRHMLVDGFRPETVVITTFTKKAAQEVRTRWLDWGLPLVAAAKAHQAFASVQGQDWLDSIDLNRCVTGTLDAICEDLLGEYRPAGTSAPTLIEGYPANQMLLRSGLRAAYNDNQGTIGAYLAPFTYSTEPPRTLADATMTSRTVMDRFVHDLMDLSSYAASAPDAGAKANLVEAYNSYRTDLASRSQVDFALLEHRFLTDLTAGALDEPVLPWKALLVDEYQDTNPLQEAIYFEIARRSGARLSVVGDDDQSLYRFRGATVELFTRFVERLAASTAMHASTEYLSRNYRSTPEIIDFFNRFVEDDPQFAPARIQPPKPKILATRPSNNLPVLGLFRSDPDTLAMDLASLLHDIFRGGGRNITIGDGSTVTLAAASGQGDFGDAVVLSHSTREFGRPFGSGPPTERLPFKLRRELAGSNIQVFNPRGQMLADQPNVQVLLGLVLECIDGSSSTAPNGELAGFAYVTNAAKDKFLEWRAAAQDFISTDPAPGRLSGFVKAWQERRSQTAEDWPDDWPLLELIFKLVCWMPDFRDDPEHQVWLEAVTRASSQARTFSAYLGSIRNRAPHDERSRRAIIMDILRPIAEGMIDVDEELIPNIPRDRLPLMTIHQSKGLEFPLVIIDVSSAYSTNHVKTAPMRFPKRPSNVASLEDALAPHTAVGAARLSRSALDRTFDDLARLYYVAYSRAQTAMIVVGLEKSIATASTVKTVATGWRRDETWAWHAHAGKRGPTVANKLPLVLI